MLLRSVARPLLSVAFIGQGLSTLRHPGDAADAASTAIAPLRPPPDATAAGPLDNPKLFVMINAAVQVGAGGLLATGRTPRIAAAALAATVIPGSLAAHAFWAEADPDRRAEKRRALLTDASLLGGLIIASADTEGRPSLGWRGRRKVEQLGEAVSSKVHGGDSHSWLHDSDLAQRIAHGLQAGAEHGRELASSAGEKGGPLLEVALSRGAEFAEVARERAPKLAEAARERGTEFAEVAREQGPKLAEAARERGTELAEAARERGVELAEVAREQAPKLAEAARERGTEFGLAGRRGRSKRKRFTVSRPRRRLAQKK